MWSSKHSTHPIHCSRELLFLSPPGQLPAEVASWQGRPGIPPVSFDSVRCHTVGWASWPCWGNSHSWHCSQRTDSLYQNQAGTWRENKTMIMHCVSNIQSTISYYCKNPTSQPTQSYTMGKLQNNSMPV